jgi:Activator of Hsp90 ATPase homolog 1-like protein
MISTGTRIEDLTLIVTEEIHVKAPPELTFAALLEQLGPYNEVPGGSNAVPTPMPMKLEAWPGGRWYRDLGGNNGHFWAVVQAIKRPTLLEFAGPLFMSYPATSNVQYRLSEEPGGTLIRFKHAAFGLISEEHRTGVVSGWSYMNNGAKKRAEAGKAH